MTTGERLVEISTLSTGTAMEHFLNISTGSGGIGDSCNIFVRASYGVDYLLPSSPSILYKKRNPVLLEYIEEDAEVIKYLNEVAVRVTLENQTFNVRYKK